MTQTRTFDIDRFVAAIEANYELGRLVMNNADAPALTLIEGLKSPRAYFELVVAAPPNPWQNTAGRYLSLIRQRIPSSTSQP